MDRGKVGTEHRFASPFRNPLLFKLAVQGRTEWIFASTQCWHVARLRGKGLGVIATRTIAPGERIMAESPLVTCTTHPRRATDAGVFSRAVHRLSVAERDAFYQLCQSEALYGAAKTAEGVWRSNAFPTAEHDDGSKDASVFAHVCRINHACAPNAHVAWSEALSQQTVHAVRQINLGDEVTVAYATPGSARAARRSLLATKFGFDCDCALCTLTGAELEQSDARQARLGAIEATLTRSPGGGSASARAVELVTEKLRLLKAEGMPVEWGHMDMVSAFTACCRSGDSAAAVPWMLGAVQAAQTMLGEDSKVVHDLERVLG